MKSFLFFGVLFYSSIGLSQMLEVETLQNGKDSITEINEVVISGSRTTQFRKNSVTAISILDQKQIKALSATSISELLNFLPGLRLETNCQTCNYTQVRMNGLGGSYSQILINGRPLFSALMGLYGLEQIPTNIIDRVEVVSGGGSVLFGANAIAGTINIFTKRPEKKRIELINKTILFPSGVLENNGQLNASWVSKSKKTGLQFTAMNKVRDGYDYNLDGYTEIPRINNIVLGLNLDQQIAKQFRLKADFWAIHEERQGGAFWRNDPQMADQSEFRNQRSYIGQWAGIWNSKKDKWEIQIYTGFQKTNRHHYTGIDHVDACGKSNNLSIHSGAQFSSKTKWGSRFENALIGGVEHAYDAIDEEIIGYQFIVKQQISQFAAFLQNQFDFAKKWSLVVGLRSTQHPRVRTPIFTPRAAVLYRIRSNWQFRLSYGNGFKAPQVYETDVHLAFANGGIAQIQVDSNLKSEYSHAYTAQISWSRPYKNFLFSNELTGFYTQLLHSFVLKEIAHEEATKTLLFRTNGSSARVGGISETFRLKWSNYLQIDMNYTYQISQFEEAQSWSLDVAPTTHFLRTPNSYGSLLVRVFPEGKWSGSVNTVYTGSMLVPHFGGAPEQLEDDLIHTEQFLDVGFKVQRDFHFHKKENTIRLSVGMQNVFNSYQKKFDTTKFRDSNFVYGPSRPRTLFLELNWVLGDSHNEK